MSWQIGSMWNIGAPGQDYVAVGAAPGVQALVPMAAFAPAQGPQLQAFAPRPSFPGPAIVQLPPNAGAGPGYAPTLQFGGRLPTLVHEHQPTTPRRKMIGFGPTDLIASGVSVTVRTQPQVIYTPERLIVPVTVAPDWSVADVKIGVRSQLGSLEALPAEMFLPDATFSSLVFETAQPSMFISIIANNKSTGDKKFEAGMYGIALE
jgi:hypothetical protein